MEYRVSISNGWSDDPTWCHPLRRQTWAALWRPTVITIAEDGKGGLTVTTAGGDGSNQWPSPVEVVRHSQGRFHAHVRRPAARLACQHGEHQPADRAHLPDRSEG
jgi:hypothetical protein